MIEARKNRVRQARWAIMPFIAITAILCGCARKEPAYWPTTEWKRASPESQGMDSTALLDAIKRKNFDQLGLHSIIVIRHGYVVAEAYRYPNAADTRHMINSVTKSFTSTAIGIAIDEGLIKGVHERVLPFFKDRYDIPKDDRKDSLTIEDLLSMRSGLNWNENNSSGASFNGLISSDDWTRFALSTPMLLKPGQVFDYNTGNSQILMGILNEATGGKAESYVRERLLDPIGIRYATWLKDPTGLVAGGHGLGMTGEDIARLGFLFLNGGRWENRQIVSDKWIKQAITPRTVSKQDFNRGRSYAYNWWIMGKDVNTAQGYAGQMLYVFPKRDLIVVTTANLDYRMYGAMHDMLLQDIPGAIRSDKPIAENAAASSELARYTAGLESEPAKTAMEIPAAFRLAKGRKVTFAPNALNLASLTILDMSADSLTYELEQTYQKSGLTRVRLVSGTDGRYRKNSLGLPHEISFFEPEPSTVLSRALKVDGNSITLESSILGSSMGLIHDRIEIAGNEVYLTRTIPGLQLSQGATGKY